MEAPKYMALIILKCCGLYVVGRFASLGDLSEVFPGDFMSHVHEFSQNFYMITRYCQINMLWCAYRRSIGSRTSLPVLGRFGVSFVDLFGVDL